MEQHPVPQHIASFEFKLFGNLTVRQFITLAIPAGVAAAIYFSNLPVVIRLPLAAALGLFGLFAALVPVGGRPLDKWLVAFTKAIMSPTQRVWVKETKLPQFLSIVVGPPPREEQIPPSITAQGRARLREYLRSLPKGEVTPLDVREQIAVQRLELETLVTEGLPSGTKVLEGKLPPPIIWPTTGFQSPALPQIGVAPKVSMAHEPRQTLPPASQRVPTRTKIPTHAKPFALPGLEKKLTRAHHEETIEIAPASPTTLGGPAPPLVKAKLASEANPLIEAVIPIRTPDRQIRLIHGIGKTRARKLHFAPPVGFDLSKLPIRGEKRFEISQELKKRFAKAESIFQEATNPKSQTTTPKVKIPKGPVKNPIQQLPHAAKTIPKPIKSLTMPDVTLKQEPLTEMDSQIKILAQKSKNVPLPSIPSPAHIVPLTHKPNIISGIVTDERANPLENVILIFKNAAGIPLRALKTNKLGQFLSATSLENGVYTVEVESELAKFVPFTVTLRGEVISPLEVKPIS